MNQDYEWLLAEKYHGDASPDFHADCARLESGEPLAYVIGHTPFLNCTIHLDSRPLIPRPETEYWTAQCITALQNTELPSPLRILDLCAGSGAIGTALAQAFPVAHLTFADIDATHLPTIEKNLTENLHPSTSDLGAAAGGNHRYHLVASDVYQQIDGVFDVIVSNPPYIDRAAETVAPSVVANEPHLALFGGEHGLELIERIIAGARAKLALPHGQLWLEHEPFQTTAIRDLALQSGLTITTHEDQYRTPRFSVLTVAQ